jgi:hypothetical protein
MKKQYMVFREREGDCVHCGHFVKEQIGYVEAKNQEEAIQLAQERWLHENYGQGGAIGENDRIEEEKFLDAKFVAIEDNG